MIDHKDLIKRKNDRNEALDLFWVFAKGCIALALIGCLMYTYDPETVSLRKDNHTLKAQIAMQTARHEARILNAVEATLLIDLIECESSGRHDAIGDDGVSFGIAQFRKETFYEFARQAGMENMHYHNPIHQLRLTEWALRNGHGNRWTCFRNMRWD